MSISRLHRWYQLSTHAERTEGRLWYSAARSSVKTISAHTGYSLRITCAVTAALSPNSRWMQNLADVKNLLDTVTYRDGPSSFDELRVTTYSANKLKAWCIAETGDVSYLQGPKVTAFYYNLLGDDGRVTLDSHAFNAYMGKRVVGAKTGKKIGKKAHAAATQAFERAAAHHGESASAFQAIIWLVWKRRIELGLVPGYSK